ncbi:hypothetical protein FK220_017160 [Flavobacteriaceae bacterium TP-CH-4]|uniref:O-antigen ligase-related domain-containing protein n=1 Tax=Pelagihabitans pacificus TaxID=2696054 RepID=A0A967E8A6_9FLAO|nr:hypothetical protein [Pelagihabitans pacificus]
MKKLNDFLLYLLIFSATFEYWDPFGIAGTITIARMVTVLYVMSSLPFFKQYLRFRFLKQYVVPLFFLVLAGIFSTIVNDIYVLDLIEIFNTRFIQLALLMVLITAHTVTNKTVLQNALKVYVLSLLITALLLMAGVGITYHSGRLFLFGENANLTGFKSVLAILIVIGGVAGQKVSLKKWVLSILLILPLLMLLIASASRGALLSLFLGLFFMLVLLKVKVVKKIVLIAVGLFFSIYFINYIMVNDRDFAKRIESTIKNAETGGRTKLWESAERVIQDNFIFGVGHSGVNPAMLKYGQKAELPHNIFLEIWLTSGILGVFFFSLFLWRIAKKLWDRYRQTGQVLGLVLFLVILANLSKSGGAIGIIFAWIFFALLIASTTQIEEISSNIYEKKGVNERL